MILIEVAVAVSYCQKYHHRHTSTQHMCNTGSPAPGFNLRRTFLARTSLVRTRVRLRTSMARTSLSVRPSPGSCLVYMPVPRRAIWGTGVRTSAARLGHGRANKAEPRHVARPGKEKVASCPQRPNSVTCSTIGARVCGQGGVRARAHRQACPGHR